MIEQGKAVIRMVERRFPDFALERRKTVQFLAKLLGLSDAQIESLFETNGFADDEMEKILTHTGFVLAYLPIEEVKNMPIF